MWMLRTTTEKGTTSRIETYEIARNEVKRRGKGERIVYNILSFQLIFSCCPHDFKLGQAEWVQSKKTLTNRPRRQLFLVQSL